MYLPDDLYESMKRRGFSPSELLQVAIRERAELADLRADGEAYLAELIAEVGEPGPEATAWAREVLAGLGDEEDRQAG